MGLLDGPGDPFAAGLGQQCLWLSRTTRQLLTRVIKLLTRVNTGDWRHSRSGT